MRIVIAVILVLVLSAYGSQSVQTDWSGGVESVVATESWGDTFESVDDVSWRSVEGQLQLASSMLGTAEEFVVYSGIAKPYAADIADLNSDGLNDIVIGAFEANEVRVFWGNSDGEWTSDLLSASSSECIGIDVADFNGDGLLDIAAACAGSDIIQIFYNQGGLTPDWVLLEAVTGFDGVHDVFAGDIDTDGDIDIVAAASEGDEVAWFRNEGTEWTKFSIETGIDYPCKVEISDIDLDGNVDIICAAWTGNLVKVWYGSGGTTPDWTAQVVDSTINGAHGISVCDVDSDGDMDIFAAALNGSSIYLYRNTGGSPIVWERDKIGVMSYAAITKIGDLDGDGDWDVVSSSFGNAGVAWWENTDNGATFVKHVVKTGGQGISWVMPGDLDNDGDLDILSVRYMSNAIYWYKISEYLAAGTLESQILDAGETPQWASIDWDVFTPTGCSFGVQFRTSSDPGNMGDWSSEYSVPSNVSGLIERYFQYRVLLNSSDPSASPILRSFQLNWDVMGIEDGEEPISLTFPNPSYGEIPFVVKSTYGGDVTLSLYDTSGRRVFAGSVQNEEQFTITNLPSGAYRAVASDEHGGVISKAVVVLPR